MTDRLVYIGGFLGGGSARDRVANALSDRRDYADIEAFTFSETYRDAESVARAVKDAKAVLTHSAGVLVAAGLLRPMNGTELHAIAPPIPRGIFDLSARRTLQKTLSMHRSIDGLERARQVTAYSLDAAKELTLHPVSNFRFLPQIARYNWRGPIDISRTVGLMDSDRYFGEPEPLEKAPCRVVQLSGQHDELLLDPNRVLDEYYTKLDEAQDC